MKKTYLVLLFAFLFFAVGIYFADKIFLFCFGYPQNLAETDWRKYSDAIEKLRPAYIAFTLITIAITLIFSVQSIRKFRKTTGSLRWAYGTLGAFGFAYFLFLAYMIIVGMIMASIGGGIIG